MSRIGLAKTVGLFLFVGTVSLVWIYFDLKPIASHAVKLHGIEVLIIRHAEKPDLGSGLSQTGDIRANAYVNYFRHFTVDGKPLHLDRLFAAKDSDKSHRPRLTLEPLSQVLGVAIDSRFSDKQSFALAQEIQALPPNQHVLICWRHGEIPELLQALAAKPQELLPDGKWPDDVFDWVVELRFDDKGRLIKGKRDQAQLPDRFGYPDTNKSASTNALK